MHELSICMGLLSLMEEESKKHDFSKVNEAIVEIGALACIEIESLKFCFGAVTRNSLAEGATLTIQSQEGTGWCLDCDEKFQVTTRLAVCPKCDGPMVNITGGDALRLVNLNVD